MSSAILHERFTRLEALRDLALMEHAEDQLRHVLDEALLALGCDYVECGQSGEHLFVRILAAGWNASTVPPIGASRAAQALMSQDRAGAVFDTADDSNGDHRELARWGWRTVLIRPFTADGKRCALAFAWRQPRESFVSEEEIDYLDLLAKIVGRIIDLSERQRRLSDKIATDPLSGLHNRAATLEHIAVAVSAAQRNGTPMAVGYIDLDGFKSINDSLGHAFGDATLSEIGRRMRTTLRKHEVAGRIGGDEFAVIFSGFENESELRRIAERVLRTLSQPFEYEGSRTAVSASLGLALYPRDGQTVEDLLRHADRAMYAAKRSKNAHYAVYQTVEEQPVQPAVPPVRQDRPAPSRSMPAAEGQFILCFQPIVNARTRRIIAAEALLRLLHPSLGLLPPDRFISNGEKNAPAIGDVDRWVFENIAGIEFDDSLRSVAIHLNVGELNESLIDGANRTRFAIELPEDLVAADTNRAIAFMNAARRRGFEVGVTNFGNASLPLTSLAELPLDFVKINASYSARAAHAIIDQAHYFGWSVIAQNIETKEQAEALSAGGVDALQGYYFSSPLTLSDFLRWTRYRAAQ